MRREIRMAVRQFREGRWRIGCRVFRRILYGLTHIRCRTCKGPKIWPQVLCFRCQFRNLTVALTCEICGCTPWMEPCDCPCHKVSEEEAC